METFVTFHICVTIDAKKGSKVGNRTGSVSSFCSNVFTDVLINVPLTKRKVDFYMVCTR